MIILPLKGQPTLHPLSSVEPSQLRGKAAFVALDDCKKDASAVFHYPKSCLQCSEQSLPLLLTLHLDGGRIYCAACFLKAIQNLEEVRAAKRDGRIPKWVRRDLREFGMSSQWSENWRDFHTMGLELLLMSGRISSAMLGGSKLVAIDPVPLGTLPDGVPWRFNVVSYLIAGVGAEILLKGLYTKRGHSIRKPDRGKPQVVAPLGSEKGKWNSPYESMSFGSLLDVENLRLVCNDPLGYTFLGVAQQWRNQSAHVPLRSAGDFAIHVLKLQMLLRALHLALLEEADEAHRERIAALLKTCQPIWHGGDNNDATSCLQGL